jgi:hypothetical protein
VLGELAEAGRRHDHQALGGQRTMREPAQVEFGSYRLVALWIRANSSINAGTVRTTTQAPEVNWLMLPGIAGCNGKGIQQRLDRGSESPRASRASHQLDERDRALPRPERRPAPAGWRATARVTASARLESWAVDASAAVISACREVVSRLRRLIGPQPAPDMPQKRQAGAPARTTGATRWVKGGASSRRPGRL